MECGLAPFTPADLPVPVLEHNAVIPSAVELAKHNCDYCISVCGLLSGTGSVLCRDLGEGQTFFVSWCSEL